MKNNVLMMVVCNSRYNAKTN